MNQNRQISINLIANTISFTVNLAISFFLTPYVITYVGKEVYGFVSLANSFTSYVSVITAALNGMLSRYVTIAVSRRNYSSASKYLSSVVIANIAIMLCLIPVSIVFIANLGRFINLPTGFEIDVKVLFAFIFASFLINLPGACFYSVPYAANRLDLSNLNNMLSALLRIALIFALLLLHSPHVWYVGFATFISVIFTIIMNLRFKKKLLPEIIIAKGEFDGKVVRELLGVGVWNSINQLNQVLMTGLDLIIANLFISVMSMNILSYAKMLPTQLVSLITMIAGIFAPVMTLAYGKSDIALFLKETKSAIKICGFLCSVPIIGLIVFGQDFFSLWLRALSPEEVRMVSVLSILTIIPQFFSVYIFPLYNISTITCKLKTPVLVFMTLGFVNVFTVFILLKTTALGIYAIAGVSSIVSLIYVLIFTPLFAAHCIGCHWSTFYSVLLRGILCNAVMIVAFSFIRHLVTINNWGQFFICCIFAAIIGYVIGFIIILDKAEHQKIRNILVAKFRKG